MKTIRKHSPNSKPDHSMHSKLFSEKSQEKKSPKKCADHLENPTPLTFTLFDLTFHHCQTYAPFVKYTQIPFLAFPLHRSKGKTFSKIIYKHR